MSQEHLPVRRQTDPPSKRDYPLAYQDSSHQIVREDEDKKKLARFDDTSGECSTKIETINGNNTLHIDNSRHYHEAPVINVLVAPDPYRPVAYPTPVIVIRESDGISFERPVRHRESSDSWFGQLAFLLIAFMGFVTLFAVIALGLKGSPAPTVVVTPPVVSEPSELGSFEDFVKSSSRRN